MSESIYRGMTQSELDAGYNNTEAVPDVQRRNASWLERSMHLRTSLDGVWDMAYGTKLRQRVDFIPCGRPDRPTYMHIHGGYWQRSAKEEFLCLAEGMLSKGVNFANIEYTLAPVATMDEIVAEVAACTCYLLSRLSELGADPGRLVVGGHSAGGHLAATLRTLPGLTGILLISGLFDLEPIQLSYLNTTLRMDMPSALRNSPIRHLHFSHPAIIVVGGSELSELQRQSRDLHASYQAAGLSSELIVVPGEDHFSILEQLVTPNGALTQSALKLLGET